MQIAGQTPKLYFLPGSINSPDSNAALDKREQRKHEQSNPKTALEHK
jgi:hypothetical protein